METDIFVVSRVLHAPSQFFERFFGKKMYACVQVCAKLAFRPRYLSMLLCSICRLTSSDVTATANLDYEPINEEITFAVGSPLKEVSINIKEDTLVEGTETFRVTLTSTDANVLDATLIVTITDDDCE